MQWSAVVQKPGDRAMAHFPRGRFFDPGMGLSGRRILIPSFGPGSFPLTAQTPPYLVFKAWWSVVFLCCSLDVLIDGYVVVPSRTWTVVPLSTASGLLAHISSIA
jgi:hypothetical protein